MLVIDHDKILEYFNVRTIGKIKAISTSKIKKIIAIKKKWREKGKRENDFGSKPHSKGEHFSRSKILFFDIILAKIIIVIMIKKIIIDIKNIDKITYTII